MQLNQLISTDKGKDKSDLVKNICNDQSSLCKSLARSVAIDTVSNMTQTSIYYFRYFFSSLRQLTYLYLPRNRDRMNLLVSSVVKGKI